MTLTHLDTEILAAMARHDDGGGFHEILNQTWLLRVLLALWYVVVAVDVPMVILTRRLRRRVAPRSD